MTRAVISVNYQATSNLSSVRLQRGGNHECQPVDNWWKPSACTKSQKDTTGLSRGISCLLLTESKPKSPDATGLARGVSRLLLFSVERESPRDEPVASSLIAETIGVATNASLHGTRPWHLRLFVQRRSRRPLDWLEASFVTSRACREMKIVGLILYDVFFNAFLALYSANLRKPRT
jgi:hypothetical protein